METPGLIADLDCEDLPEITGPERLDWLRGHMKEALFGSDRIVEAASAEILHYGYPGLYFLIWRDLVCYVGQAGHIPTRLQQQLAVGRPVEKIAVLIGIPPWALTEFEHAYIRAWNPPWNSESKRCGQLDELPELIAAAEALDRSKVMPWHTPYLTPPAGPHKDWELAVIGRLQWEDEQAGLPRRKF